MPDQRPEPLAYATPRRRDGDVWRVVDVLVRLLALAVGLFWVTAALLALYAAAVIVVRAISS